MERRSRLGQNGAVTVTQRPLGARALARAELTSRIMGAARAQIAASGAPSLSLRAIARELGMASSAIYRYFPSRDDLITALLLESYGALADLAEAADASVGDPTDLDARWLAIWRAVRRWAVAHPHDYALLYGSPIPGYRAPDATIVPVTRLTSTFVRLLRLVVAAGGRPVASVEVDAGTRASIASAREFFADAAVVRGLMAWTGLFGALSFELFGHYVHVVDDYGTFFDHLVRQWQADLTAGS